MTILNFWKHLKIKLRLFSALKISVCLAAAYRYIMGQKRHPRLHRHRDRSKYSFVGYPLPIPRKCPSALPNPFTICAGGQSYVFLEKTKRPSLNFSKKTMASRIKASWASKPYFLPRSPPIAKNSYQPATSGSIRSSPDAKSPMTT